jgi:hypothetical protein
MSIFLPFFLLERNASNAIKKTFSVDFLETIIISFVFQIFLFLVPVLRMYTDLQIEQQWNHNKNRIQQKGKGGGGASHTHSLLQS